jgi:hypothetical protein
MSNIRNQASFERGAWDWEPLNECFGETHIRPTDLDGFVERKGKFLVLEAKGSNVDIPEGQWRTFQALRETKLFTILVIWGPQNEPQSALLLTRQGKYRYDRADWQTIQNIVSWWFEGVNAN